MILVDTTVWIDFFNGRASLPAQAFEALLARREMLCVTDIVLTEILRGFPSDTDHVRARVFLSDFPSITARAPKTFLLAADLFRQCRKKGFTVRSTVDCLIAAVCLENDIRLLHRDADFDVLAKCCRLRTVDPEDEI
jgi:predicted nucleic acid-binding protein